MHFQEQNRLAGGMFFSKRRARKVKVFTLRDTWLFISKHKSTHGGVPEWRLSGENAIFGAGKQKIRLADNLKIGCRVSPAFGLKLST
jgi:hypothetical protein